MARSLHSTIRVFQIELKVRSRYLGELSGITPQVHTLRIFAVGLPTVERVQSAAGAGCTHFENSCPTVDYSKKSIFNGESIR